ncbi:restriction endonuclease subunit S [Paracidovorax oryzae]|uniref:restriction endonuclease subunit S n=1 Tax=Paracidovorax oryzae TaxID=862720 RepID=UPI0035CEEC92
MTKLPESWAMAALSSVCERIVDGSHNPPRPAELGRPMLSARNIQSGAIKFDDYRLISEADFILEHRRTQVAPNDVLLTIVGTIGRVAVVPTAIQEFALQRSVAVLKPNTAIIPRYLAYALESPRVQQHFLDTAKGTAQKGIYLKALGALEIELAPQAEQTRIADQLDTLLARVNACNDHLDAIPGILKRFRQAALNAAAGTNFLGNAPEAPLRVVQLHTVLEEPLRNGKSVRDGAGLSVLRLTSLKPSGLDLKESKAGDWSDVPDVNRFLIQNGDYLVSRGNGSKDRVGLGGLVRGCKEDLAFPDTMIRIRPDQAKLIPEYLNYVWSSQLVRQQIERVAKTTAGIWKVSQPDLESISFPLPDLDEQIEIVGRVAGLLKLADRIEARYTALRAQAQLLAPQVLSKAFRGELVEQDPKDEPASVLLQRLAATASAKAPSSRGRPRAQPQVPATLPAPQAPAPIDWHTLPNNDWAAPTAAPDQAITACLTAVLRAWGQPMPELEARLATLLCQHPRVFTAVLPKAQAKEWVRLVGDEAKPLLAQVARLQPASNSPWGQAIKRMRARGDLVEAGSADDTTWSLGPGASAIVTEGWPDGRAAFVVAHLRAHGVASILPALAPADQAFVHVRAA